MTEEKVEIEKKEETGESPEIIRKIDSELRYLGNEMERLFLGSNWRDPFAYDSETRLTRLNLVDMGDSFTLDAEMPGIPKKDIEIEVTGNSIEICGKTSADEEKGNGSYYLRESFQSKYYRKIRLPEEIKPEKAKAKLDHGILHLEMPKKNPSEQAHKIAVD